MIPTRLTLMFLALMAGCSSAPFAYQSQMAETSYRIDVGQSTGTAVVVSCVPVGPIWHVTMLTAAHVVQASSTTPWTAWSPESVISEIVLLSEHPEHDAALVRGISFRAVPVAPICARAPMVGEMVIVPGFPRGYFYISMGLISGSDSMSAQVSGGNSGGAVWGSGGVIGLVTAVYQGLAHGPIPMHFEINHMALFVPIENIAEWLREHGMLAA